jgi:hypothetical protein
VAQHCAVEAVQSRGPERVRVRLVELASDSHSFASVADKDWLFERVKEALTR